MTADEFVARVQRFSPRVDEAPLHGGSREELARVQRRFACPTRDAGKVKACVLEDLLSRYDCSALEIGRVRFVRCPRPHWAGLVVGSFEAEPIVLTRSGEIAVFEHERFGELLLPCARDGASYLGALVGFLALAQDLRHWLERADQAALHCAALAGGVRYELFYTGLCGALEYGALAPDLGPV